MHLTALAVVSSRRFFINFGPRFPAAFFFTAWNCNRGLITICDSVSPIQFSEFHGGETNHVESRISLRSSTFTGLNLIPEDHIHIRLIIGSAQLKCIALD